MLYLPIILADHKSSGMLAEGAARKGDGSGDTKGFRFLLIQYFCLLHLVSAW